MRAIVIRFIVQCATEQLHSAATLILEVMYGLLKHQSVSAVLEKRTLPRKVSDKEKVYVTVIILYNYFHVQSFPMQSVNLHGSFPKPDAIECSSSVTDDVATVSCGDIDGQPNTGDIFCSIDSGDIEICK